MDRQELYNNIETELTQNPNRSDRKIGEAAGVDGKTVKKYRLEREARLAAEGTSLPKAAVPKTNSRHHDGLLSFPASSKPPKVVHPTHPTSTLRVIDQIRLAAAKGNRLAFFFGLLLGGFVPFGTWALIHLDHWLPWQTALIVGGCSFSGWTVIAWGRAAFGNRVSAFGSQVKATGFAVLVEGLMVGSSLEWLSMSALVLLVLINAIATAVNLVLEKEQL